MREHGIGLRRVPHVFLDAEIRDRSVQVQRRAHADRRQIGRAMAAHPHVVQGGEIRDAAQVRDAAGVHDRRADIVDQLFLDELLAVPDRVEHLADGERRHGVLADQAEIRLVLGRRRVLHPEQVERLECLAEPRGLDRRQPVVHVVQQVRFRAEPRGAVLRRACGTCARYFSVDQMFSLGRFASAGS